MGRTIPFPRRTDMVGNEGEATTEPTRQPVQVLVHPLKLVGRDWEYLLLRRIPEQGGFWQGVTGGVEGRESLADAARRELIEEIFKRSDKALIHVFADNHPAMNTYRKVGFRPFNSYVLIKGQRT